MLYHLFHHYFSNFHFLTLCVFLEKKFFEFWQIPSTYVQWHPTSVSLSATQILYLPVYFSSFPFIFLFIGVPLASLCAVCTTL